MGPAVGPPVPIGVVAFEAVTGETETLLEFVKLGIEALGADVVLEFDAVIGLIGDEEEETAVPLGTNELYG